MKKIFISFIIIMFTLSACDDGFEELNVNPTKPVQLDPSTKFTYVQIYTGGSSYVAYLFWNIIHLMQNVQHLNNTSYASFLYKEGNTHWLFEEQFSTTVKNIADLEAQLELSTEPTATMDLAITKVQKVLIFSRITDVYGDIPYSEAGKGFLEGIRFPKYDQQSAIYADMLLSLESATATLSAGGTSSFGSADLMFSGDVAKWNKFANSLMLRLALRMVKVDEAAAKSWATKAIDGGVMTSNEDIAYIQYENSANDGGPNVNPLTKGFTSRASTQVKISKTFMDFMKTRNDPRVSVLASTVDGNTDFALQFGQDINDETRGEANSKPNINIFGGSGTVIYDAPFFFQTYAEVEFMLAESAERWGLAGGSSNVETHYNAGVTAAMQYLSMYGSAADITTTQINDYLSANPFVPTQALKMINEQYWVATFGNGLETFSNWKRSGYPELVPANVAATLTNGEIPRRLPYPASEKLNNSTNVEAAIAVQGGDLLTTRMWWDKN
ncbi:SusD/RagB family nutrient-binding outer membrane lipoprotein [Polaribacter sp. HaHaR_3_91]|uniref:SusD/RagB family nutrient-binding outer membrane lipoprotein n=1 Tax=Polaribacter sp. HaHaR_3_91 TaxID=2745561 RepID=UPI001C4F150F|nr:SusD/RagB family nutrient-binding outer membrane lipoprotein [Polaribacter sp. HaHaR_3_91]QXP64014.1 SusD/RagB family nutrient-binding outer membrane lipoprotein [Polaribacter sp. HaHaR_3_91]